MKSTQKTISISVALFVILIGSFLFAGCSSTETAQVDAAVQRTEPTEVILPTETPDPAVLLESMIEKYEESVFIQSGWLHYTYAHESDLENGVVLPNDRLFPKDYVWESWYWLNEDGYVAEYITSIIDLEGNIVQQSVFTNGIEYNMTFNLRHTQSENFKLSLDLGTAQMMLDKNERELPLFAEEDQIDGRDVVHFFSEHRHDVLNYMSNSSQPVQRTNKELILDRTSGAILEEKTIFILEDGTEESFSRAFDFVLEWDELPVDLMQLLESVKDGSALDINGNPPVRTREEILDRLEMMNERAAERYLSLGWVKIIEQEVRLITGETDENGTPISVMVDVESYYLIGEDGKVLQSVTVSDGEIIVYQDKLFTNLLHPEESSTEPEDFFLTGLDNGLAVDLRNAPNLKLEMFDENIGLTTLTVTEMYEGELTDEAGVTAVGFFSSYLFDLTSGYPMVIQHSYIMPDGSLLAKTNILTELVENVDAPPDYILEYLED